MMSVWLKPKRNEIRKIKQKELLNTLFYIYTALKKSV